MTRAQHAAWVGKQEPIPATDKLKADGWLPKAVFRQALASKKSSNPLISLTKNPTQFCMFTPCKRAY